ncbi:hypothetical protein L0F63_001268 [Massospora cicadina]|nr:hypothetical protein L0F63_001268 [Massospora cicadina]
MNVHPDASPLLDPRIAAREFLDLKEHSDSAPDYYSALKSNAQFADLEAKFTVPPEAIIPPQLFEDPLIFDGWGDQPARLRSYQLNQPQTTNKELNSTSTGNPSLKNEAYTSCTVDIFKEKLSAIHSIGQRKYALDKILEDSGLHSLSHVARTAFVSQKREQLNALKFTSVKNVKNQRITSEVKKGDLIYEVSVYPPGKPPSKKMQEFKILGSQPLTALRDAIYCAEDFFPCPNFEKELESERRVVEFNMNQVPAVVLNVPPLNRDNTASKKTSSSYFFIEGTLYIDCRSPNFLDYGVEVIRWFKDPQRKETLPDVKKGENV